MLIMEPDFCGAMWRNAALMHSHTPFKLTAMTRSKSSSSVSPSGVSGAPTPALLTAMLIGPKASLVIWNNFSTSLALLTSVTIATQRWPWDVKSAAAWSAAALSMSATPTATPASASRAAQARPMPAPPPVTTATFPFNSANIVTFLCWRCAWNFKL